MQGRLLKKSLDAAKNKEKELEITIAKLKTESHEFILQESIVFQVTYVIMLLAL
ncbi:uncharacterized protein G2W53_007334 [Senna tora]|uniref:Uncharacterized protein n=1 Tax=Senna tora TaxID=362788 RepID=A0A834X630_9FABA|nr:uncharacterized protein G2W53_007334 [Senna tora]